MLEYHRKNKEAIIRTLSYADIFSYPLKRSEVYKYLIGDKTDPAKIYNLLERMANNGQIGFHEGYYFLNGSKQSYTMRLSREKESRRKLNIALRVSQVLSLIPSVRLIGISGSLSMNNSKKQDDIDLFIITSKNTLWITRFTVNVVLSLMNIKRGKKETTGMDRICPNMFITTSSLKITENLFTAHEVSQLKIVVNKDKTYEKFLSVNSWVLRYMPHATKKMHVSGKDRGQNIFVTAINKVFFFAQYMYMRRGMTTEKVAEDMAFFHPKDKTNFAIEIYEAKYDNYMAYLDRLASNIHVSRHD